MVFEALDLNISTFIALAYNGKIDEIKVIQNHYETEEKTFKNPLIFVKK